ncbi:ABC transporter ATP-binding protein [Natronosalvus vescus]|uniref:ABC transporter ATP-binding protein n=1 Tax=Natronosalvus vescus TaxID=2953881 RepID=UPI0020902B2A|nr:ABC transporter ATP-binding protein [Natronosalvus vescus]
MANGLDAPQNLSWREKFTALYRVATFRPLYTAGIVVLSAFTALLEGIGLSFILPIIELAEGETDPNEAEGLLHAFVVVYESIGVPFTLGYLIVGVTIVMTVRYTSTFLVSWLQGAIETYYIRHLQSTAFNNALDAEISYFDQEGSDDILNAIVTQAEYAGKVIRYSIRTFEAVLLSIVYVSIALYLAPMLTIFAAAFLGFVTFFFRYVLEAGYSIGDRVADANERVQQAAQAGTQGIREVKLFGITRELQSQFSRGIDQFTQSRIRLLRNEAAIGSYYQLATAVAVFVLIYLALTWTTLSIGALGVFLFAMFQLGPQISQLNRYAYKTEGELPHLVRTQEFVDRLQASSETDEGTRSLSEQIKEIRFEDVTFSYEETGEQVLNSVSFDVTCDQFVAFVGQSGAGKSTIASLLTRMYDPDSGRITANGIPIQEFELSAWRSRVSIVQQDPHIFNDTLRRNITLGNREASHEEIERVSEIAQVTEFLDGLPKGYETKLGDDGVRLSGGQRQRVALARALLKDADLLILDEATSDLDSTIEQRVHEGIDEMDRDYATLVIAHRLSTVVNANQIYTMDDGQIIESGDHNQLLEEDGQYATLYATQSS